MVLLFAIAAAVPLHFHFDATEFSNAVYHTLASPDASFAARTCTPWSWNEMYHVQRKTARGSMSWKSVGGIEMQAREGLMFAID